MSNSVPNLADTENEDRRSLIGSISKAVNKARARRNSIVGLQSPPSSPTSVSPAQPTSPATEPHATPVPRPPSPVRSSDSVEVKENGRATRRASLFKWLKDGVGSRSGEDQIATTSWRKQAEASNNNVPSVPRYTRVYEEMNRLTNDFRQTTVDNPFP